MCGLRTSFVQVGLTQVICIEPDWKHPKWWEHFEQAKRILEAGEVWLKIRFAHLEIYCESVPFSGWVLAASVGMRRRIPGAESPFGGQASSRPGLKPRPISEARATTELFGHPAC